MHITVLNLANRTEKALGAALYTVQEGVPRLWDAAMMVAVAVLHPLGLLKDTHVAEIAEIWQERASERADEFDPIA